MRASDWYAGKSALVTGASSGIGEAFARALAQRGLGLFLTALPEEHAQLAATADQLAQGYGVRVETVGINLAEPEAAQQLQLAADQRAFQPDLLVNSAGIGGGGLFAEAPLDRQIEMIRLNVAALVGLTGLYLPRMTARGDGGIINVASTAAFGPMPYLAVYAASKAFVLSFGQAIWAEHHRLGVRVITLCAGPVATRFHERAGDTGQALGFRRRVRERYLTPDSVTARALEGLERDEPVVVCRMAGLNSVYAPVAAATRVLPVRWRLLIGERVARWYFKQERKLGR